MVFHLNGLQYLSFSSLSLYAAISTSTPTPNEWPQITRVFPTLASPLRLTCRVATDGLTLENRHSSQVCRQAGVLKAKARLVNPRHCHRSFRRNTHLFPGKNDPVGEQKRPPAFETTFSQSADLLVEHVL